ncbi:MAG: potassium-transporting ATPase subunit B, partial [Oscillospiraceae bacterium]
MAVKSNNILSDKKMIIRAIKDSFIKLNPKVQAQNPVMLLVYVAAVLTGIIWVISLFGLKDADSGYTFAIGIILLFTVLFANFAEAIAEGRGKAQADTLKSTKKDTKAKLLKSDGSYDIVSA